MIIDVVKDFRCGVEFAVHPLCTAHTGETNCIVNQPILRCTALVFTALQLHFIQCPFPNQILITLIKCLKGHKSLGSLFNCLMFQNQKVTQSV